MDIQPSFERISEAFATASQEIALIPKVPSFNTGQLVLASTEALAKTVDRLKKYTTIRNLESRLVFPFATSSAAPIAELNNELRSLT